MRFLPFASLDSGATQRCTRALLAAAVLAIAARTVGAQEPAPVQPHGEAVSAGTAGAAKTAAPASAVPGADPDPMSALPLIRQTDPGIGSAQTFSLSFMMVVLIGLLAAAALRRVRRRPLTTTAMGATWGWRQMLSPRSSGDLRLLHSMRLTSRASVHVVQWGDRKWLLACTEERVTQLAERAQVETETQP